MVTIREVRDADVVKIRELFIDVYGFVPVAYCPSLERLMQTYPRLGYVVMSNLARGVSRKLRHMA